MVTSIPCWSLASPRRSGGNGPGGWPVASHWSISPHSSIWCAELMTCCGGATRGEGGSRTLGSPRHDVPRCGSLLGGGHPRDPWRAAVRRGRTNHGLALTCRVPSTDEESGDTLSVARVDLKTFTGPDLSVTRLAYMCGIQLVTPRSAADACSGRRDELDDCGQRTVTPTTLIATSSQRIEPLPSGRTARL